jgi:hypothetical protein
MTVPALEPLVVFDARDESWRGDPKILAWCRAEGLDPEQIYRLEVYLLDAPFARVYEFVTLNGARFLVEERDDYLRRDPYDVILSTLPPDWAPEGTTP